MGELKELLASEAWVPVPGYEGLYEVSNLGRVRSLTFRDSYGGSRLLDVPRLLTPSAERYARVTLGKEGANRAIGIHVLVATAFVGARPGGHQCAHLNGNAHDNRASNLAWVTPKINEQHKLIHNTRARGERNGGAKLTEDAVRDIRARYRKGCGAALASEYGVALSVIVAIGRKRTWRHVQ